MQETSNKKDNIFIFARKVVISTLSGIVLISGISFVAAAAVATRAPLEDARPLTSLMRAVRSGEISLQSVNSSFAAFARSLPRHVADLRAAVRPAIQSVPTDLASNLSPQIHLQELDFSPPSLKLLVQTAGEVADGTLVREFALPKKQVSIQGTDGRRIAVVGTNISLAGNVDPAQFIPRVLTSNDFTMFKLAKNIASAWSGIPQLAANPFPNIAVATPASSQTEGVVLGASTTQAEQNTASAAKKATLPFLDRLSLSLYCAFASRGEVIDTRRCDYAAVANGIVQPASQAPVAVIEPAASSTASLATSTPADAAPTAGTGSSAPVYITRYVTEYVPVPGPRGRDGTDGTDGEDGRDGQDGVTTINNIQAPLGFGSYVIPTYSNPSASIGISTIGYLKDTTIDAPLINGGTANNLDLFAPTSRNAVFNGLSIFNDIATFTGNVLVNDFTATSSVALNATTTNAYISNLFVDAATSTDSYITRLIAASSTLTDAMLTNSTTTNAYIASLFAASSTISDLVLSNASTTNATTTNAYVRNLFADYSTTTNAYVDYLSASTSTANTLTVAGDVFVNGTTTLATTTITDMIASRATTTNFFSTDSFLTNATATNLFTQNLSVGNSSINGNQSIYGSFEVTGTSTMGADVYLNGSVVIGTSSNEFLTINALVDSHVEPAQNKVFDLGSASFYWRTLYADSINVNSISAASTTISGTSNNTFGINSDNGTNDMEDASLIFFRGLVTPNAVMRWSAASKRFEANQSLRVMNETPSIGTTTLTVQSGVGQGSTNLFELVNNIGTKLSVFDASGWLGIGSSTPGYPLAVIGNSYFGGDVTATGTLTVSGTASSSIMGALGIGTTTPGASLHVQNNDGTGAAFRVSRSGAATVDIQTAPGFGYFGTVSNDPLAFFTNNSGARMLISTAGNVGIGTTTPGSKLTVAGDISATGTYKINGTIIAQASTTLNNYFFGNAGNATATGDANVAVGRSAGQGVTTGFQNVFVGTYAGTANTDGYVNTFVGNNAGAANTSGAGNSFFGGQAGGSNTTGGYNSFIGAYAGLSNTTGSYNSFTGYSAGYSNTTGSGNSFMGYQAGRYLSNGTSAASSTNNSVYLGYNTKASSNTATNEIAIGYDAIGGGSNTVTLGSTSIATTVLQGNVGIGTTTPGSRLDVVGTSGVAGLRVLGSGATQASLQVGALGDGFFSPSFSIYSAYNASYPSLSLSAGGNGLLNQWGVGAYMFSYNASGTSIERMRIDGPTGNVGIGTTTPGSKLTVAGDISATGTYKINGTTIAQASTTLGNYFFGDAGNLTGAGVLNTGVGSLALANNATNYNTAVGGNALRYNTTGASNSALGSGALTANVSGSNNAAFGTNALSSSLGSNNSAFGMSALTSNTTGYGNAALGYSALYHNVTGQYNVGIGFSAGTFLSNGSTANQASNNSIFVGYNTKSGAATSSNEIVIGYDAIGGGSNTVTLGSTSIATTILQGNVGIGTTTPGSKLQVSASSDVQALFKGNAGYSGGITLDTTNIGNTGVRFANSGTTKLGLLQGLSATSLLDVYDYSDSVSRLTVQEAGNVGIGTTTPGSKLTVAGDISATGTYKINGTTIAQASTTLNNYFFGNAGNATATGTSNVAVGSQALSSNTGGFENTAVGHLAAFSNTGGVHNTAVGTAALYANTTGNYNTAFGGAATSLQWYSALRFNTTGSNNSAFGLGALAGNTTGSLNTAVGTAALYGANGSITGSNNTALGQSALYVLETGANNTASGVGSLISLSSGSFNVAMGSGSGSGLTTGSYNTIIGSNITSLPTGLSNAVLIGANFGGSTIENGSVVIADGSGNRRINVDSSGNVGIGSTTPGYKLSVVGSGYFGGNLTATGTLTLSGTATSSIMGALGIGIAAPEAPLHVYRATTNGIGGELVLDNNAASILNKTAITFADGGYSNARAQIAVGLDSNTQGNFQFLTGTGTLTERMRITSAGNVGIGTTTPGSKLSVAGGSSETPVVVDSTGANTLLQFFSSSASKGYIGYTGSGSQGLGVWNAAGNTVNLLVTNAGTVGIGTTTPGEKLVVVGNATFGNDSGIKITSSGIERKDTLGVNVLSGGQGLSSTYGSQVVTTGNAYELLPGYLDLYAGLNTGAPIRFFQSQGVEAMRIDAVGRLGVGTTTPNNLLSVYDLVDFNNTDLNTKLGYQAGKYIKADAIKNTYVGYQAGTASSTGSTNVADSNSAFGYQAFFSNTAGSENTALGSESLKSNTTGIRNTAIGATALFKNTTAGNNLAIGYAALYENVIGTRNVAIGSSALQNSTSDDNVGIGSSALLSLSGGYQNTAIGASAAALATTGLNNTSVGFNSMYSNITGSHNTSIGGEALRQNATATNMTAIGWRAGYGVGGAYTSQGGSLFGYAAGYKMQTGSDYNTLLGYQSGYELTTGARNILIGPSTIAASYGQVTTGSNNIAIGNEVAVASSTASNQLVIGNLIYGTGLSGTGATVSTGNIGIGTTTPARLLTLANTGTAPQIMLEDKDAGTNARYGNIGFADGAMTFGGGRDGDYLNIMWENIMNAAGNFGVGTTTSITSRMAVYQNDSTNGGLMINMGHADNNTSALSILKAGTNGNYISAGGFTLSGSGNMTVGGNITATGTLSVTGTATSSISGPFTVQGLTVGKGGGAVVTTTAFGVNALSSNISGPYDTAIGYDALLSNTTGDENVAVGYYALRSNTTTHKNTAVGSQALTSNIGTGNTSFGYLSLGQNVSTSYNVALGYRAGYNASTPLTANANSVFIGADANSSADSLTNVIAIGYQAQATQSNQVVLGNSSVTQTLLRGNVGIGTTTPSTALEVGNSGKIRASAALTNQSVSMYTDSASQSYLESETGSYGLDIKALYTGGSKIRFFTNGNNERMRIESNGDVGIGTTSPAFKLDVNGTLSAGTTTVTGLNVTGNLTTYAGGKHIMYRSASDAYGWQMYPNAGNTLMFTTGVGGAGTTILSITDSGAAALNGTLSTTGTSTFATASGNVGIGTTNPGSKLEVNGNVTITSGDMQLGNAYAVKALSPWGDYRAMLTSVGGSKTILRAVDDNPADGVEIQNFTGGSLAYFQTGGNVGIGTTTPSTLLHLESATPGITIQRNNGATATGGLYLKGSDGVADWSLTTNTSIGSGFELLSGVTPAMYVKTTGEFGIGTTTQSYKLTVENGTDGNMFQLSRPSHNTWSSTISAFDGFGSNIANGSMALFPTISADFAINTNPAAAAGFVVKADGKVGIGTTSPSVSKLTITDLNNDFLAFSRPSQGTWYMGNNSGGFALNDVSIASTTAVVKLYVQGTTGNVGIGTASPAAKLEVSGDIYLSQGASRTIKIPDPSVNVVGGDLTLQAGNAGTGGGATDSGNLILRAGNPFSSTGFGSQYGDVKVYAGDNVSGGRNGDFIVHTGDGSLERFRIVGDTGNIGIGTTTPNNLLTVNQASDTTSGTINSYGISLYNQGVANMTLGSDASYNYLQSWASKPLSINSQGNNTLINVNSGNVGIGTTNPQGKLDIRDGDTNSLIFTDSDVAHGITSSFPTEVYGKIGTLSGSAGGLNVVGISDTDATAIQLFGTMGTTDPTDATPAILLHADKKNGGTDRAALGALETILQVENLSTKLMTILGSGNVGIGTTTPGSKLDLWHSTSTSNVDVFRIGTDVGSTNNIVFRVDSDGDMFTDGATTVGTPADVAESYMAVEAVDPGTVVAFASTTTAWSAVHGSATSSASSTDVYEISGVRKAHDGYEAVGVVSTRPGLHLGANIVNGVPVALSGRVPVKVTTEAGVVKAGDYLTVSATRPGYAMKLTGEGKSIGRAVSAYVQGNDKVMVFIENGYQKLDTTGRYASSTSMLTTGNIDLNANAVAIINIKSLASASGAWSISEDGRIVARVICLEDVCIDKTQLANILNSTGQTGIVGSGAVGSGDATTTSAGQVAGTSTEASLVDTVGTVGTVDTGNTVDPVDTVDAVGTEDPTEAPVETAPVEVTPTETAPEATPTPEPTPEPAPAPEPTPAPTPEPAPEPAPEPLPEPAPAPQVTEPATVTESAPPVAEAPAAEPAA